MYFSSDNNNAHYHSQKNHSHNGDYAVAVKYGGGEMARAAATAMDDGSMLDGGIQHVGVGCGSVERLSFVISPTDGGGSVDDELDRLRHRNASGSLSSHDYEEMSTSSGASLRSTPTYEHRHLCTHHSQQQQQQHGQHLTVHSPRVIALDFEGNDNVVDAWLEAA